MASKQTYKERLIDAFDNNKIFVWIALVLSGVIIAGQVASSWDVLWLGGEDKERRCNQVSQNIRQVELDIKSIFGSTDHVINALEVRYNLIRHGNLILEAEESNCFSNDWKKQSLDQIKAIIFPGIYNYIKNGEEILAEELNKKELSLVCSEVLGYFAKYDVVVLSSEEENILLKTIQIASYED